MKTLLKLFAGCTAIALLSGCASVLCGPQQKVAIDSRPLGAEVLVYDSRGEIVYKNTTPCVAKLDRRDHDMLESASYVILIRKEGFAPVQIPLSGIVNRAYFANILFGGVGLIVDPVTGSMWTLSPHSVNSKLVSENASFFTSNGGLLVSLREEVPADLVPALEPLK